MADSAASMTPESLRGRRDVWIAVAVAVVAAIATYALSVQNGFAYDDEPMLRENRLIHSLADLPDALARPYWLQYGTLYRPLTTLAFGIDWAIGGGAPWVYHALNTCWHALCAALVVRLALRWLTPTAAALAGLAFAVHPVHVEAVSNSVGRAELMCGAALLAVAILSTRAAARPRDQWLLVMLCSFAALGSKETGVVAPAIAMAGAWMATRDPRAALRLGGAALAGVAPLLAARVIVLGSLGGDQPHVAFQVVSWGHGLVFALSMLPRAVGIMVVPQRPVYEYSPTTAQLDHPDVALVVAGVAIVLIAAAVIVAHVRRPSWLAFALGFTVVTLAPVANVFFRTGVVLAERTMYSPSVGIVLALATGFAALFARRRLIAIAVAAAWCATSAALAWHDVRVWDTTDSVVEAFTARNPESYAGWMFLGNTGVIEGDRPKALAAYRRGLALFDGDHRLVHAGAVQMILAGDTVEATKWLELALAKWPASRRSRTVLIRIRVAQHDGRGALKLIDDGLKIEPDQRGWSQLRDSLRAAH
jgi:hypothetical protein